MASSPNPRESDPLCQSGPAPQPCPFEVPISLLNLRMDRIEESHAWIAERLGRNGKRGLLSEANDHADANASELRGAIRALEERQSKLDSKLWWLIVLLAGNGALQIGPEILQLFAGAG